MKHLLQKQQQQQRGGGCERNLWQSNEILSINSQEDFNIRDNSSDNAIIRRFFYVRARTNAVPHTLLRLQLQE